MPLVNTAKFGSVCDISEQIASGATTSVPYTRQVQHGPDYANPTSTQPLALSVGTTGGPTSINVEIDGEITLGASATITLDLTTLNSKTLAKCRGFQVLNLAAPDAGVNSNLSMAAGASNGFTAGGKLTTTNQTIEPASQVAALNRNSAGWTVNSTNKTVTFTAGSAGCTFRYLFWGE